MAIDVIDAAVAGTVMAVARDPGAGAGMVTVAVAGLAVGAGMAIVAAGGLAVGAGMAIVAAGGLAVGAGMAVIVGGGLAAGIGGRSLDLRSATVMPLVMGRVGLKTLFGELMMSSAAVNQSPQRLLLNINMVQHHRTSWFETL